MDKNRKWVSPVITYNKGLEYINKKYSPEYDDVLIIQNAEGYHYGDIISYAKENVTHENYISFACLSFSPNIKFLSSPSLAVLMD